LLNRLGDHKVRDRVHRELPEAALDACRPDDTENGVRTTRYEGLEEVGRCRVSKECSEVVASFWYRRRIVICVAGLDPVNLQEMMTYGTRISTRQRHGA